MKITFNPITLALACRTVASLAFTSVAWGQSFQDPEPGQLKVKGIFIPSQSISGVDQIFHTPRFFHDPDRDGMIELGIGAHRINSSTGSTSDPVYSIGDWRNNWEPNASKFIEWDKLSNDYFYSDQILFRAPNEFYGTYSEGGLLFAASLTGHPRKTILPTPPGITAFDSIQWANDLNGDGWDDIFYYGYDGSLSINIGRYDLQSLAPSWSHSDANLQAYLPRPINGYSKAGPPDLNGDGVGDFLCCYELLWSGPPNPLEYLYRAYSGTDGSILWERILSSEDALCSHSFASDFNGNGTIDFIRLGYFSWDWQTNTFKSTGFLEAIDGGTGQSLWRIPSTFLDPNWLRGINPEAYATPSRTLLPIPDVDLDGVGDILTSTLIITPSDPFRRMQFVAVSGKSGAILRRYDLPNDVRVWSPDPIRVVGNIDRAAPVGDLDNDGWPEIGIPFATPSLSANGSLGIYSHGLCFLSIPSLNIDNKVSPNGLMKCGVSVPSMPNSQFIMLGSTSCNPRGGVSFGRWKSVLQPSPALAYSTRNPHTGWLDSNGRSSFNLRVPPLPPSLGQDLHFQAIVFDNGPNRRVKTITNLESVRI